MRAQYRQQLGTRSGRTGHRASVSDGIRERERGAASCPTLVKALAVLAGVTPGEVNKWCRGRAAVPVWAGVIAVVLQDRSPEARTIDLEETHQALAAPQDPKP